MENKEAMKQFMETLIEIIDMKIVMNESIIDFFVNDLILLICNILSLK